MIREYKGFLIVNTHFANKARKREMPYAYFDSNIRDHLYYAASLKEAKKEIDNIYNRLD